MLLSRRSLLLAASLTAAPCPAWARELSPGVFSHGVASGDPLSDRVILWTRFAHSGGGRIGWEIAEDEAFARVTQRGEAVANFADDFCVKVDAGGLAPGRPYFYRFLSASGPSVTGRTLTAPGRGAEQLTVAAMSCANLGFGYFHAYGHVAEREDIDLVLHLGDYIYEIQRGAYPSAGEAVPGRIIDPSNETVTLADYYQRFASYHTDPDLLELRRLKPISATWDDHEFANNAWREGASSHDPATEGSYANRAAAAAKAFFDWMPVRRPEPRGMRVYRSFDWGDLARIVVLDTRFIGRDQELDYEDDLYARMAEAGADAEALATAFKRDHINNPNRSLLGAAQERWTNDTLAESKRAGQPWQIIAQQVILARQIFSPGSSRLLSPTVSAGSRAWVEGNERMGAYDISWNSDGWTGYGASRTRFLESLTANTNNAVVLAGDSHNCWVSGVPSAEAGRRAANEFAVGSITSPGFERTLSTAQPGEREALFKAGNPDMVFCDVTRRGYGTLRFTRGECAAEWLTFADIRSPTRGEPEVARFRMASSAQGGPGPWTMT